MVSRAERIAKRASEGVLTPPGVKIRRLWPLYVGRAGVVRNLIMTDGNHEFLVVVDDDLLAAMRDSKPYSVEDAPRPDNIPGVILLQLVRRRLVGNKWLRQV